MLFKIPYSDWGWALFGAFHCWLGKISMHPVQIVLGSVMLIYAFWPVRRRVVRR